MKVNIISIIGDHVNIKVTDNKKPARSGQIGRPVRRPVRQGRGHRSDKIGDLHKDSYRTLISIQEYKTGHPIDRRSGVVDFSDSVRSSQETH
jgi:hypothetical protein